MCPLCTTEQPPTVLGRLGLKLWVRCRACGIDFHLHVHDEDEACELSEH